MPDDLLKWVGYWASTATGVSPPDNVSANFVQGDKNTNTWVTYQYSDDIVAYIDDTANSDVYVTLGTTFSRVPAVQPRGTYRATILLTVTE